MLGWLKHRPIRVEVTFPHAESVIHRIECLIAAAVTRLEEKIMLTRDELIEQVRSRFTNTEAVISTELAEIGSAILSLRDQMGELQRKLEEALAGGDFTSLAAEIMGGFDNIQTRISGMNEALQPTPPVEPPIEPPVEPPIPIPIPIPIPVEPPPVEPVIPNAARR